MSQAPAIQLNSQQSEAFEQLLGFLEDSDAKIFILKGYAGTGKTTLLQYLGNHLNERHKVFSLLAPTGRAAAVLSAKTGLRAHTIHSELYHFKEIEGDADPEKKNPTADDFGQMSLRFDIRNPDDQSEKLYIIDEASMVSDEKNDQTSFATFGSGHLLTDLLRLAGKNKLIFAGDPCQLPPVGSTKSPALSTAHFSRLGLGTFSYELTQILRQKQDSEVLKLATRVRKMTGISFNTKWIKIPAVPSSQIQIQSYENLKESYIRKVISEGTEKLIGIALSNKNCMDINESTRLRLYGTANAPVQRGDLLMITQNNYLVPLTNGDFAKVEWVGAQESVKGISFIQVQVKAQLTDKLHKVLLCTEPLYSGNQNLNGFQQRQLMIAFSQRMRSKGLKPKSVGYYDEMKKDPYLNSLRANFGYAVTCHKSQGGEWDEVFFFLNKGMYVMEPPELSRWWYTGITRAKENLHLVKEWWIG
jgi:ATP-dependent exoDNAse (exonuclease V) alpha subunit